VQNSVAKGSENKMGSVSGIALDTTDSFFHQQCFDYQTQRPVQHQPQQRSDDRLSTEEIEVLRSDIRRARPVLVLNN
jgi:hypothetical protein